jgi:translation initiation factor 2B subunit (eIF-2B alpha/beta/delta family)
MDHRLRDIADTLAMDGNSGASEMMASTLNDLLAIPEDAMVSIPPSDWEEFAIALHRAKPSIAPLFNIANTILLLLERGADGIGDLHGAIMDLRERERKSGLRITELSAETIRGERLMTTSYSSTVAQVLKALAKDRAIKVTVAEALPGGEGRQFAKILSGHSMQVEIIHDSTVFSRMADIDAVLVGADSVTWSGLVNKIGTRAIAEAARVFDVDAFAVCGRSKMSPVMLSDLITYEKELGPNLAEFVQVFESTPLELFTFLITDDRVIAPANLKQELQGNRTARAWYERNVLTDPAGSLREQ